MSLWRQRQVRSGRGARRSPPARCGLRVEWLEDGLVPSTLTVTTALDEFDGGTPTNPAGPDGQLSLREAMSAASNGDMINFAAGLGGSTIHLNPAKGELFLNKNLNI